MADDLIYLHTLEKANSYIKLDLAPVRMDIDDFYAVLQLINNTDCEGLRIEVDGFVLDDPRKIEKLANPRIKDLVIETSKPSYLSIKLNPDTATIYAGDDRMMTKGLITRVAEVLAPPPVLRILKRQWWVSVLLIQIPFAIADITPKFVSVVLLLIVIAVYVFALFMPSFIFYVRPETRQFLEEA